jgi:hypothetical protein
MVKKLRTKEFWKTEDALLWVWWRSFGLSLVLSFVAATGTTWVTISIDTARYMLSAIMGVSGAILGFLVVYLSFALDGIRRLFGRYSNAIFRKDRFIWSMCGFLALIILLSLAAMCVVDHRGWFLRLLFNLSCFSFSIAIATVVWFGKMILRRTDTAEEIRKEIELIKLDDFREEPKANWNWGASYWIITENRENLVDQINSVLLHNIVEKNNSLVSNMLSHLLGQIAILIQTSEDNNKNGRAICRYSNILLLSFEQAKNHNDPLIFKLIFNSYRNLGTLIAMQKMNREVIDAALKDVRMTVSYWLEQENEQLVDDAIRTYIYMCQFQIDYNLPVEQETWRKEESGRMVVIDTGIARANYEKMIAIVLAGTYEIISLTEQALQCKNRAITEMVVGKLGAFLEHIIVANIDSEYERGILGRKAAFNCSWLGRKYVEMHHTTPLGFLRLFADETSLDRLLQKDSDLANYVFNQWAEFAKFLIDNNYFASIDLYLIGNLGRRIAYQSEKFPTGLGIFGVLVDINRSARRKLMRSLVAKVTPKNSKEITDFISELDKDLDSWIKGLEESHHPDDAIIALLKANQWFQ